jgi:hypothetical protein
MNAVLFFALYVPWLAGSLVVMALVGRHFKRV